MNDAMPVSLRDKQARQAIELCCPVTVSGGQEWYDMEATIPINLDAITDALKWFEYRGRETQGFRVFRIHNHPNLIRFENVPDTWNAGYASQLHCA